MSKKNLYQIVTCLIFACLCTSFPSCSKEEHEEEKDEYERTENVSNQDPEGTIVLNMESNSSENYYKIGNLGEIHIN